MATPKVRGSIANGTSSKRSKTDFYQTPQGFTRALLEREKFYHKVWEPAAGEGAISMVLAEAGYEVLSTDKYPRRGYGQEDFLNSDRTGYDIVTNPPFRATIQFAEKAFELCYRKFAMVGPISVLNSSSRFEAMWSKMPVRAIYLAPRYQHILCDRGMISSQFTHCWYIIDKGYVGSTKFYWLPNVIYKSEETGEIR